MKIAMFTDSYKPQINGVVRSIDLFAGELRKRGHRVEIFAPSETMNDKIEKDVYKFSSLGFVLYKEYRLGFGFDVFTEYFRNKNFDIVHVHSPFTMGLAGLGYAKRNKKKIVGSFHTMFPEYLHYFIKSDLILNNKNIMEFAKTRAWKYFTWFYNRCDIVITPSEHIKKILKKNGIKKKIVVIPTGIKHSKIKTKTSAEIRKKYNLGREKIILHVGRISKEKNIDKILDAFSKAELENARLVITSDGPYRKKLEQLAKKLGIINKIVFTGYIPDKELFGLYKIADLFVMASETETQGLVLNDAMKFGVPCIVLNAPVVSDFVRENKIGVVANNNNLHKKIKEMLKKDCTKFRENCKKNISKYDISKCAERLVDVYRKLIA